MNETVCCHDRLVPVHHTAPCCNREYCNMKKVFFNAFFWLVMDQLVGNVFTGLLCHGKYLTAVWPITACLAAIIACVTGQWVTRSVPTLHSQDSD